MLDFLFVTSPTNARNPHPPYYFMYLAAYLRNKGLEVDIIDVKGGDRPNDIDRHFTTIRDLLEQKASRFIGVAAFHSDYPAVVRLGKLVKSVRPGSVLLVGNAHSTINPEDFIYSGSPFDIAVLGEGEETCYELYQKFSRKLPEGAAREIETVRGIAYLETGYDFGTSNKRVVKTTPRPFMDLSYLPMPAYDLVDMEYYLRPQKLIIRRIYTSMVCIFSGRGCPYNCDFCCANAVWKANKGKAARLRPVLNVVEEIAWLRKKYKIDFFYLFDDMFGMNAKWINDWFWQKDNVIQIADIPYACQTRADIATEEMVRGLKGTGCIQLDIGVESGSQSLLDNVNKKITIEQIRQVFEWCRKYKLRSFATMLLNLPRETSQDLKQTYDFLKKISPSAGVIFGVTTPYPGTKIYENYCKPLKKEEYHLLINNRLNPIERFRMAEHDIDLEKLWNKWNRKFLATPMFERMWCLRPYQRLYWTTIFRSTRLRQYVKCWGKDVPKTFCLWWLHKLRIYRIVKRLQYGEKWK